MVRAGALGDVLLLRRAVATLRAAGHSVHLLAPSAPGVVLVGPGPGEVTRTTALDGAEAAAWLAGEPAGETFADRLGAVLQSHALRPCLIDVTDTDQPHAIHRRIQTRMLGAEMADAHDSDIEHVWYRRRA